MKKRILVIGAALALLIVGCNSARPYYNIDNWYVRQNAVPQYFARYDVFYLHPEFYVGMVQSISNHDYTVKYTSDLFGKKVRIFAPLCRKAEDAEEALEWYLDNYHDSGRPFVFIGEGEGRKMLKPLIEDSWKQGLVSYHWGRPTTNMVMRITAEIDEFLYRRDWGDKWEERMARDPEADTEEDETE